MEPAQARLSAHLAEKERQLSGRADELRRKLRLDQPQDLALRVGAAYLPLGPGRGELHLPLWERPVVIAFPELAAVDGRDEPLPVFLQALLLYHLAAADGIALEDRWVSFADLPGGRTYASAFQGYTGNELARRFDTQDSFTRACQAVGGRPLGLGDAAFSFSPLPRLPLALVYWQGDEDFPANVSVLFDPTACHYQTIDGCAILGSMLTARVLHAAG